MASHDTLNTVFFLSFGGARRSSQGTVSLDEEIQKREMNMRAELEKLNELKQMKAAEVAQRKYDRLDYGGESEDDNGLPAPYRDQHIAFRELQKDAEKWKKMKLSILIEHEMVQEEKKKLADRLEILKLKETIQKMEMTLNAKQGIPSHPGKVKDRLGLKEVPKVSVFSKPMKQETGGRQFQLSGTKRKSLVSNNQPVKMNRKKGNKNNNHGVNKLPDELVLTTITAQGPRPARPRIEFSSLPADLVLTELTEDGPKPRVHSVKEDDDKVVHLVEEEEDVNMPQEEEEEDDLNRYETNNQTLF